MTEQAPEATAPVIYWVAFDPFEDTVVALIMIENEIVFVRENGEWIVPDATWDERLNGFDTLTVDESAVAVYDSTDTPTLEDFDEVPE